MSRKPSVIYRWIGKKIPQTGVLVLEVIGTRKNKSRNGQIRSALYVKVLCPDCDKPFETRVSGILNQTTRRCFACGRRKWAAAGAKAARRFGEKNSAWKGGKSRHKGYVLIRTPGGYQAEHRLVMEKVL